MDRSEQHADPQPSDSSANSSWIPCRQFSVSLITSNPDAPASVKAAAVAIHGDRVEIVRAKAIPSSSGPCISPPRWTIVRYFGTTGAPRWRTSPIGIPESAPISRLIIPATMRTLLAVDTAVSLHRSRHPEPERPSTESDVELAAAGDTSADPSLS